ncbi:MAG: DUF2634 domain-containing protein [Chloroflexi bacterium]|nr:DUF2634 domain-containing protein [Chloroflexota bacterium]
MTDAQDLSVELLPAEDEEIDPQADLEAAAASALDDVPAEAPANDPPAPLGKTWLFDFAEGRFLRSGAAPAEGRGFDSIRMWCLMAMHSARYAHPCFGDAFGMEEPEEPIGETVNSELLADYERKLREALTVHDRIVGLVNFEAYFNPLEGVLEIDNFDVVLDDDALVEIGQVSVRVEGTL